MLEIHYEATFWSSLIQTFWNFDIVQNGRLATIFSTRKTYFALILKNEKIAFLLEIYIIRLLFGLVACGPFTFFYGNMWELQNRKQFVCIVVFFSHNINYIHKRGRHRSLNFSSYIAKLSFWSLPILATFTIHITCVCFSDSEDELDESVEIAGDEDDDEGMSTVYFISIASPWITWDCHNNWPSN